jgi:transposase
LIPKKSGERIKTNRRDAVTLARLFRAGELTSVWVPDTVHEAVRDLVRAREAASQDLRRKRQQLLSFPLRHGRIFSGRQHWSRAHLHWLARQKFDHPAQQIVFQDAVDTIDDAATRRRRLDQQVAAIVPSWSMAPVVQAYQAMRGVSFVVAVTFVAEIGDLRRFDNPRQLMAFLGLVPAERSTGERVRRAGLTPGWQPASPAGADRGRLELSLSGPRQPNSASPDRGPAQSGSSDRLEGANSPVRPLSPAQCRRQEAARGDCCDRPRDGGVSVGHRPPRRARGLIATTGQRQWPEQTASAPHPIIECVRERHRGKSG